MLWLVRKIGPALHDGLGGINTTAIRDAFELFGVPPGARPMMFERVMAYCAGLTDDGRRKAEADG